MADQLAIYKHALVLLGERTIASLSEAREPVRVFDDIWDETKQFCLEQGMWKFAMLRQRLEPEAAGGFGYSNKFLYPTGLIHLFALSLSVSFDPQIVDDFVDDGNRFHANADLLEIRYSSNDSQNAGGNLVRWTQTFAFYVAARLALNTCYRLTGSLEREKSLMTIENRQLQIALAIDSLVTMNGLKPFNAQARGVVADLPIRKPIDPMPFMAGLVMGPQGKADG